MSLVKVKIGDVCNIEKGKTGILKAIPGEFPMVVTSEVRKSHNEYQFDDEAVIVPLVSGTGHGHASIKRIHFQKGKFALGSILCAIIPKDKSQLSAEYLFRFLDLNKENELVARMKGMANVTLPIKEIAQIQIPLPTIKEQAEFVGMYKDLEAKSSLLFTELTHQLALLKKLRQQLLQDAMQGKLVEQNKKDEPASVLLKNIKIAKEKLIAEKRQKKDKDLKPIKPEEIPFEIPSNWVWCRLGELISYSKGKRPNFLSKLKNDKYSIPYIDIAAFEKGIIYQYTNGEKAIICNKDEILLVWDGARMGLCGTDVEGAVGSTLIKINSIKIVKEFLFQFLKMNFSFFNSNPKQAGLPHMNSDLFNNLLFPIPPLAEQNRIIQKLDELMQYCNELEASIKQSVSQNSTLLQQVLREALRKEPVEV